MGNALRFLYSCCKPSAADDSDSLRPHGVSPATVAVSRLAHDLLNFETTSQVPDGLGNHVVSSKKAQAKWYRKLLEAWRQANPPPRTAEEASRLVVQALIRHQKADVEGLLGFYGLPLPHKLVHQSSGVPTSLPPGTKFEMQTLPVDPKAVVDGDGMTVYVDASEARESSCIPREVLVAAVKRSKARTNRNFDRANKLHEKIIEAGYRVLYIQNQEILARKYRIRMRGIDAPETKQPYGKQSQDELTKIVQGKCLRIFVYDEDQYGRIVGDIYCDGMFVQELMLKKGMAWHYAAFDQRIELASWENDARAKRIGLWASSNPQQPWDWRRKNPREG